MGLEIEFEYEDTRDSAWSPARETAPLPTRLIRRRSAGPPASNPLIVHLGIALTAIALGAASMAGFLAGRTATSDRAVSLLHLAPVDPFVVQPLHVPPAAPWTNTFDQDVSLSVINDGPDPVTVLGATLSAPQFQAVDLTPAHPAPTAPGGISLLRGRARFVCGDYPPDRVATVARLRARTADGAIRRETLEVDRSSQVAEQAVCALMPTPQVVSSTAFSPPSASGSYTAQITAINRAPFPLRMALPQSAVQSWTSYGGLYPSAPGDVIIPPRGVGLITITVKVTDCPTAQQAATDGYTYDTLAFSDARDTPGSPKARMIDQTVPISDLNAIMAYCLANEPPLGGGR